MASNIRLPEFSLQPTFEWQEEIYGITYSHTTRRGEQMNIYVGNLSPRTSEEELRGVFKEFGDVDSVKIIKDNFTGKSKGFGFVEMPDQSQAQAAIAGLNGKELGESSLTVNEARPRENRAGGGGGRPGGRGGHGGGFGGGRGPGGGGRQRY